MNRKTYRFIEAERVDATKRFLSAARQRLNQLIKVLELVHKIEMCNNKILIEIMLPEIFIYFFIKFEWNHPDAEFYRDKRNKREGF